MDIEQRKKQWIDFLDLSSDVNRMTILYCAEREPYTMLGFREESIGQRAEGSYRQYLRQVETADLIPDHSIPHIKAHGGTEIFAEAFGCNVRRMGSIQSPFAEPMVFSAGEAAKLHEPRLEDTRLMDILEVAQRVKNRVGGNPLCSFPDIQSPAGIAAMIWEKSDFFASMIEEPEIVLDVIGKTKRLLCDFLSLWIRTFGRETIAHYPAYYMPFGVTLSDDEIGSVSSGAFHTFFEPSLVELSERYGALGIHCCADSRHQWDNLASIPGLKLLNLHRDTAQTQESFARFRGVCAQMPMDGDADPNALPDQVGLHVARFAYVNTVEDAKRAVERFMA